MTQTLNTFPAPKTDAQCIQLWDAVIDAAARASREWLDPESGITRYPGGLGSASVKIPNRGAFAKWLIATGRGYTFASYPGVNLRTWAQYGFPETGQSESHSVHVVSAIARVLESYGLRPDCSSYNS